MILLAGCGRTDPPRSDLGDPQAGSTTITRHHCGSCHRIPGVQLADGMAGPPLGGIAGRIYLAGRLLNTPDNMILWLRDPQAVSPSNAMPDVGLSEREAQDIAAYLYTLR